MNRRSKVRRAWFWEIAARAEVLGVLLWVCATLMMTSTSAANDESDLEKLTSLIRAGNLTEAEDLTNALLKAHPDASDAPASKLSWLHFAIEDKLASRLGGPRKACDFYFDRAHTRRENGDLDSFIADYERIVELSDFYALDRNRLPALNALAWIFATHTEARFRDGKKAILYATKACEISARYVYDSMRDSRYRDTLAAAYAETGDFTQAVKWEKKALEDAPSDKIDSYKERLRLYENHKPYRE